MEWQPIETAPLDKSVLLLMSGGARTVGQWQLQSSHKKARPYWETERGWLFGKAWDRDHQPTHWMPLPALPDEAK